MKSMPVIIVCTFWMLVLVVLVSSTIWGGAAVQTWLRDYGVLVSAVLAAAITSVYVVFTYDQARAAQTNLKFQFGAGLGGPKLELVQEERDRPPGDRIPDTYQYPAEYRRRALPHETSGVRDAEQVEVRGQTKYEMIRITNQSANPIDTVSLSLSLCHGETKKDFSYEHSKPINGREKVEIAVWPVQDMPNYHLAVTGHFVDAVGKRALTPCEVER